jgi:peptidoglycan hydrolase-like protein with peptidoglycan-binding domain
LSPQPGNFGWRFTHNPESLISLFEPGYWSVLDQAAVMSFEAAHGLSVDGVPGPTVWSALLRAVALRQIDPNPYDYVVASEKLPERLEVWRNGAVVYTSLANTGVKGAATPLGTWPVHQRFVSETMRGVNPNGYHYVDKGVHDIAYFYGSDAVHGFVRASYGWPQSNGCVELPLRAAKVVFGLDPLGTLVTVTSQALPT